MSNPAPASIFRLFALVGLLLSAPVHAATEDVARIKGVAERLLQARVHETYGASASVTLLDPDPRMTLARCSEPPEAFLPPSARLHGSTSVGVRCTGDKSWTVYVRARVAVWQSVVVTTTALPRGQLLAGSDLKLKKVDVSRLSGGYLRRLDQAMAMELKRAVGPAVVLTTGMLGAPVLISRGEQVTLVSLHNNLRVAVAGKALSDGAMGERIRVENAASRRRMEGVVSAPGVVRMAQH